MKKAAVIGGGPAGLTAALYLARAAIDVTVFDGGFFGGKMNDTPEIENYPGFLSVSGFLLSEKMAENAKNAGVKTVYEEVLSVDKTENGFEITHGGKTEPFDAVIIATGTRKRMLGIAGEEKFAGRGVSYCALCDGGFFKDKTVFVIGGGNTAIGDAVYLAKLCKEVFVVHRRDELRAERHLVSAARALENVKFILSAVPTEIKGDKRVSAIVIKSNEGETEYPTDGVFMAIGADPETSLVKKLGITEQSGYVLADREGVTEVKGLFAAGDIVLKNCRQIATAVGDGASAAASAIHYLNSMED